MIYLEEESHTISNDFIGAIVDTLDRIINTIAAELPYETHHPGVESQLLVLRQWLRGYRVFFDPASTPLMGVLTLERQNTVLTALTGINAYADVLWRGLANGEPCAMSHVHCIEGMRGSLNQLHFILSSPAFASAS